MTETETREPGKISKNRIVTLDLAKLKKHGIVVIRLPKPINPDVEPDHTNILILKLSDDIKKVSCDDGDNKVVLEIEHNRRDLPPMYTILYCAAKLMPIVDATEMVVRFDRKHINHPTFEDVCATLLHLASDARRGYGDIPPVYFIKDKLVGKSSQLLRAVPVAADYDPDLGKDGHEES